MCHLYLGNFFRKVVLLRASSNLEAPTPVQKFYTGLYRAHSYIFSIQNCGFTWIPECSIFMIRGFGYTEPALLLRPCPSVMNSGLPLALDMCWWFAPLLAGGTRLQELTCCMTHTGLPCRHLRFHLSHHRQLPTPEHVTFFPSFLPYLWCIPGQLHPFKSLPEDCGDRPWHAEVPPLSKRRPPGCSKTGLVPFSLWKWRPTPLVG